MDVLSSILLSSTWGIGLCVLVVGIGVLVATAYKCYRRLTNVNFKSTLALALIGGVIGGIILNIGCKIMMTMALGLSITTQ